MARKATGQARFRNGRWFARVTIGKNRPTFELPVYVARDEQDEKKAKERAGVMAQIASDLAKAEQPIDFIHNLVKQASEAEAAKLTKILRVVDSACVSGVVKQGSRDGMTFKDLASKWTSGELARDYPDHVRAKRPNSIRDDVTRLEKHVIPIVGEVPIASFTLEDAERVMAALPSDLRPATRRHVAQSMARLLKIAVYPLRLRAPSLPDGSRSSGTERR
jgi:hypothetical protein